MCVALFSVTLMKVGIHYVHMLYLKRENMRSSRACTSVTNGVKMLSTKMTTYIWCILNQIKKSLHFVIVIVALTFKAMNLDFQQLAYGRGYTMQMTNYNIIKSKGHMMEPSGSPDSTSLKWDSVSLSISFWYPHEKWKIWLEPTDKMIKQECVLSTRMTHSHYHILCLGDREIWIKTRIWHYN